MHQPKLVAIVGVIGLVVNVVGLCLLYGKFFLTIFQSKNIL